MKGLKLKAMKMKLSSEFGTFQTFSGTFGGFAMYACTSVHTKDNYRYSVNLTSG